MNNRDHLQTLFVEYISGEMNDDRFQILERSLREDAALRNQFIEYLNVDQALGDLAALPESERAEFDEQHHAIAAAFQDTCESVEGRRLKSVDTVSRLSGAITITGGLAAALLIAVGVWITLAGSGRDNDRTTTDSAYPIAELLTRVDAVLKKNTVIWNSDTLSAGGFHLERGLVHLRFDGGVAVYIEAPTRFDVVSSKRVVLHNGRLSASVPSSGVGFTVATPEAEVTDFGTEFSVDVAAGTSEVHVFEGLVRVKPTSPDNDGPVNAVDLRTSQAIKIQSVTDLPVEIELATDRFIRTFDESRRRYAHTVKRFAPMAFYRMAIRDQGLTCIPPQYSGVVLTGDGNRPPHARGVFAGGSLRVLADSIGRGGRVDSSPPVQTGRLTLTAFVYLDSKARSSMVATNIQNDGGAYSLELDEMGFLRATVRNSHGDLLSVSSNEPLVPRTWLHIVLTVDGKRLCLYEDGRLVTASPCLPLADSRGDVLWFGTDADGLRLWNGRIDEVAVFDRALSEAEVTELYQAAVEEMGTSK